MALVPRTYSDRRGDKPLLPSPFNANELMLLQASIGAYVDAQDLTAAGSTLAAAEAYTDAAVSGGLVGAVQYEQTPPDYGWAGWAYDPTKSTSTNVLTSGTIQGARIKLPVGVTLANIVSHVGTAGSGLTAAQCFGGLYTTGGVLIAKTGDLSAVYNSTGLKTNALTVQGGQSLTFSAGSVVIAALLFNGTTPPALQRLSTSLGAPIYNSNVNRFFSLAAQTTLPAPATLGASSFTYWMAVS